MVTQPLEEEEEMLMPGTGKVGTILQKAGVSKDQIEKLTVVVKELYDEGVSIDDISTVINKIAEDKSFQQDFFANPSIAIEKLGLKGKTGVNPKTGA